MDFLGKLFVKNFRLEPKKKRKETELYQGRRRVEWDYFRWEKEGFGETNVVAWFYTMDLLIACPAQTW